MTHTSKELVKKVLHEIVIPALDKVGLGGRAAQELVLGTGIQESGLILRKQLFGGPACGLWQMEPVTFRDIWNRYVCKHKSLHESLLHILGSENPNVGTLIINDHFAAAMCRVLYLRVPAPLPSSGDIVGQAYYWKRYYNTPLGQGRSVEYIAKWHTFVDRETFGDVL